MSTATAGFTPAGARSTATRVRVTSTLGALLRQRLRRDRWQLLIWVLAIGALAAFSAESIEQTYGSAAARTQLIQLAIANPTILVLRGIPQGAGVAALTFFEIYTFIALMAGLMNTFLAVRHSRAEEEQGRAELVAATPAGRLLPTTATVVHATVANILLAVVTGLGFVAAGLPVGGSFVAGAATGGAGLAFFGVGLLFAQVFSTSRGSNGFAAAVVVLAYVVRGIGDATATTVGDGLRMRPAWPSWLSPIGWGEQTGAYTADDLRPVLLQVAFAAVLVAGVFALQAVRDSGAGLIASRAGRADASRRLGGAFGLAWRLQAPTVLGWTIGGALGGLLAGALGSVVNSSLAQNPDLAGIREAMRRIGAGGSGPLTSLFISAILSIVGVLAAAAAVQAVIRLRQEEASGTAELMLATPLSRVRWLLSFLAVGAIAVVLVLLAAAVAAGLSAVSAGESVTTIGDSFSAALAQSPVALVYLGVLALVFVVLPSWTAPVGWAALGVGAFVGIFGGLVQLPEWLRHLSPFADAPVVVGDVDWTGGYWMLGITVAALAGAAVLIRRRDLALG
ncbi:ABC transporter permease [Leifsonia sp. SIMBA_070]|uniref:ABC transporter permease n=1 Tax=Leifsonia sp. SIMBA_070 TaxID=3085810 RepID=UPI00397A59A0